MLTWGTAYVISEWLVRIVMLVYVPQRRSPASARAWLLLIFFLPALGLVLYAMIGRAYLPPRRLEQQARIIELMQSMPQRITSVAHPAPRFEPEVAQAVRLAHNLGSFDVAQANRIEFLPDYQGSLDRLLRDIAEARQSVHLLYYIFADDGTGRRAAEALEQAARRGVSCRVLLDSVGSRAALHKLTPRLRAAGV